ncbi:MAG TPA: hypothetical protein VFL76_08715 [Edaphocola sp.]|nr:hypothetical protein [Edaphocola sp.]
MCFLLAGMVSFHPAKAQLAPARYNRFNDHTCRWRVLSTSAYDLYFPDGYDSLAAFASRRLPAIMRDVKKATGGALEQPPNIIIYPSLTQSYESNVGMNDAGVQAFPTITLKGNRVTLAFNGAYEQFLEELRTAWVKMVWENAFKNDPEEQAGNKKLLIPDWYKEGSIRYFSEGWPLERENELLALSRELQPRSWNDMAAAGPALAGQAFCYYLSERYREDAAKQVFFQLRNGKSLARAARLIAKRPLPNLEAACFEFYQKRFAAYPYQCSVADSMVKDKKKEEGKMISSANSPDKKSKARVIEKGNYRTVYLQTGNKPPVRVLRYALPPWLSDHGHDPYPLIAWEDNDVLLAALPVKGRIQVRRFGAGGRERDFNTLYGVDGLTALKAEDKGHWLLDAFRKGKSDIVRYDTRRLRYGPVTDDEADNTELSLLSIDGKEMMAYRSGFPADSLWHPDTAAKRYGIYLEDLSGKGRSVAVNGGKLLLADSDYRQWHQPALLKDNKIAVGSYRNGFIHRDTLPLNGISGAAKDTGQPVSPWLKEYRQRQRAADSLKALELKLKERDVSLLGKMLRQGSEQGSYQDHEDSVRRALAYAPEKVKPYILQLYSAYFIAGINNDYYINRYQPFRTHLGAFKFPEVGAMARGGFSDLFDNHRFNMGYRMPTGTEGSDFFFRYENTTREPDWHVLFFRSVQSLQPDPDRDWKDAQGRTYPAAAKVKTQYYELGVHFPLTYDMSLNFQAAARGDRTVFLATDKYSLDFDDLAQWWSISTLSFAINKTQALPVLFLKKGWAAKLVTDGMLALERPSTILYGAQLELGDHQPLGKGINLVTRVRAGYSGGQSHILYNFGGLDNNIVPGVDSTVIFRQDAPYAFQTLVTPFRGYRQNSLYGNRYGLLSLDLYAPLFQKLVPLQTSFTALDELQLGLFTDMATAAGPGAVNARAVKDTKASFGLSARTLLAGYPVRFDLAWPGSLDKKPVWYLSLSL